VIAAGTEPSLIGSRSASARTVDRRARACLSIPAETSTPASVWDALEDTPEAAENMKIRSALMHELVAYIENAGVTQSEAA